MKSTVVLMSLFALSVAETASPDAPREPLSTGEQRSEPCPLHCSRCLFTDDIYQHPLPFPPYMSYALRQQFVPSYGQFDLLERSLGEEPSEKNEKSSGSRVRRQVSERARELASNHEDRNGQPRPVGRLYGYGDLQASGNNRNNYNAYLGAGVGSVLWRSGNNRHSVGVGATVDQYRGRFMGYPYRSRPNYGVGLGYRWRF